MKEKNMPRKKSKQNETELSLPFVDKDVLDAHAAEHEENDSLPVLLATKRADENLVRLLLSLGEDPSEADDTSWAPLHEAAWQGNAAISRVLLEGGADIEAATGQGDRALHIAAMEDHAGVISVLIDYKAESEVENDLALTPFVLAIINNSNRAAESLLRYGADYSDVDVDHATLLHHAADRNNVVAIHLLLEAGLPIDQRDRAGKTALHWACAGICPAAIETLLEAGADPAARDYDGNTILHAAVGAYLFADDTHPEAAASTPRTVQELENGSFRMAALPENEKAFQKFVRRFAPTPRLPRALPENRRRPRYNYRFRQACRQIVHGLLQREDIEAAIEAENKAGETPIMVAHKAGFTDIVDILLAHGADPSGIDLCEGLKGFDAYTVTVLDALDAFGGAINRRDISNLNGFVDPDVEVETVGAAVGGSGCIPSPSTSAEELGDSLETLFEQYPSHLWAEFAGLEFGDKKSERTACLALAEGTPDNVQATIHIEVTNNLISRIAFHSIAREIKALQRSGLYPW
jgi:ankyrin repeat protein